MLGGFDAANYGTERLWATAPDGVRVPVSLVYRRDKAKLDGSDPLLLDGRGGPLTLLACLAHTSCHVREAPAAAALPACRLPRTASWGGVRGTPACMQVRRVRDEQRPGLQPEQAEPDRPRRHLRHCARARRR